MFVYHNRLDHKNQNLVDNFPIALSKYKKRKTIPLGKPHFSGSLQQHVFLCRSRPLLSWVSSQENSRLLQTLRHRGEEGKGAGLSLSQLCGNQRVQPRWKLWRLWLVEQSFLQRGSGLMEDIIEPDTLPSLVLSTRLPWPFCLCPSSSWLSCWPLWKGQERHYLEVSSEWKHLQKVGGRLTRVREQIAFQSAFPHFAKMVLGFRYIIPKPPIQSLRWLSNVPYAGPTSCWPLKQPNEQSNCLQFVTIINKDAVNI